jgi:peptidoglycan/xylan/chitin deacetylase (PgdA/CDA1 family)
LNPGSLLFIFIFICIFTSAAAQAGELKQINDHGVVLTYHHVSEDTPPSTSVTPAKFAAQLAYIDANGYIVWPLTRLIEKLRARQSVPDNVLAITFDDAYQSVFTQARKLLQAYGWPYTVFVTTDGIDDNLIPYMSWSQLKTLADEGVEIGNHSQTHGHLANRLAGEDSASWEDRVREDIETAQRRIKDELNLTATLFAYPYGEYTRALSAEIETMGLTGFGQHSGAIGFESDFSALPRFPVGGAYTDLELLATRLNARPLTIRAFPPGPMLGDSENLRPALMLQIAPGPYDPNRIGCFASDQGRMLLEPTADREVFKIQPRKPLKPGRSKFNCTIPHQSRPDEFFWWSYLVVMP